jgi:hypothetical protein
MKLVLPTEYCPTSSTNGFASAAPARARARAAWPPACVCARARARCGRAGGRGRESARTRARRCVRWPRPKTRAPRGKVFFVPFAKDEAFDYPYLGIHVSTFNPILECPLMPRFAVGERVREVGVGRSRATRLLVTVRRTGSRGTSPRCARRRRCGAPHAAAVSRAVVSSRAQGTARRRD